MNLVNNILPSTSNPFNSQLADSNLTPSFFQQNNPEEPPQRSIQSILQERDVSFFKNSPGAFTFHEEKKTYLTNNTTSVFKTYQAESLLTEMFFSGKNLTNVQNLIGYLVNKQTNYVISRQSDDELLQVMKNYYVEYNQHPPLLLRTDTSEKRQMLLKMYIDEVSRLNQLVLNAVVPKVISEMQQYLGYLHDAGSQPIPLSTPQSTSIKGRFDLRSPTQVFFGGDF